MYDEKVIEYYSDKMTPELFEVFCEARYLRTLGLRWGEVARTFRIHFLTAKKWVEMVEHVDKEKVEEIGKRMVVERYRREKLQRLIRKHAA